MERQFGREGGCLPLCTQMLREELMKLKRYLFIIVVILSLSAQALADEWQGFHVGVNIGYCKGHNQMTDLNVAGHPDAGSANSYGMIGGLQLGYDVKMSNWIIGLSGLVDASDVRGEHVFIHGTSSNNVVSYETKRMGTVTGRAGYLFNDAILPYVRVGMAWARNKYEDSDHSLGAGSYIDNAELTRSGWLVGLGIEYMIKSSISAFAEYNHIEFGKKDITLTEVEGPLSGKKYRYEIDQDMGALLIGLNYHF